MAYDCVCTDTMSGALREHEDADVVFWRLSESWAEDQAVCLAVRPNQTLIYDKNGKISNRIGPK